MFQVNRGASGPAGREHVIDNQDPLVLTAGVLVDLQRVGAVLQVVACLVGRGRELARLADRHEPTAQGGGDGLHRVGQWQFLGQHPGRDQRPGIANA